MPSPVAVFPTDEEILEVEVLLVPRMLRSIAALVSVLAPVPALAAIPANPQGSGVIINAVTWLQGTLLGTVATVAAVIAVAAVGFMMLTGRINWRHGAVVILGCFILFGAASIVAGIRAAAGGG
jgi:type IV secretory pathway VirB2 component (pilin)